jgi:hypothetical protein
MPEALLQTQCPVRFRPNVDRTPALGHVDNRFIVETGVVGLKLDSLDALALALTARTSADELQRLPQIANTCRDTCQGRTQR